MQKTMSVITKAMLSPRQAFSQLIKTTSSYFNWDGYGW